MKTKIVFNKCLPSTREPFVRYVPVWGWLLLLALYLLPLTFIVVYLNSGYYLIQRIWLYTALLLPGLMLCYYLGFRGAIVANIFKFPLFYLHGSRAFVERSEASMVLTSHLALLMITVFFIGLMAETMKRQEEKLKMLSITDELSGLFNHRFFYQCLEKEVDRARRYKLPLSLVIIDLDDFKKYNDSWGHPQGDRAISLAASVLKETVRTTDIVARYGGEEFAIILPQTNLMDAKQICERVREALAKTPVPTVSGVTEPLTASFGVVVREPSMTASELVTEADKILYYAKSSGKNLVTCK
ncbi:MAG: GGDEF domain-containing protein [Clostridiales bacterium]|jgi:diguanylate cyclase (GGDEF)-like protein|nr:GGDEF domain-containing protein [Clostridiales bacterium]